MEHPPLNSLALVARRLSVPLAAVLIGFVMITLALSPARAGDDLLAGLPGPPTATAGRASVTIWLGAGKAGKKDKAAESLTKVHAAMADRGWGFAGMESYVENGDLQGFWVTYVDARTTARN